jgi:hypothetical protein
MILETAVSDIEMNKSKIKPGTQYDPIKLTVHICEGKRKKESKNPRKLSVCCAIRNSPPKMTKSRYRVRNKCKIRTSLPHILW